MLHGRDEVFRTDLNIQMLQVSEKPKKDKTSSSLKTTIPQTTCAIHYNLNYLTYAKHHFKQEIIITLEVI